MTEVEVVPGKPLPCCVYFDAALEHAEALPEGSHKLAGLVLAHVRDGEGRQKQSRVVYFVPARGRGKKRVAALYLPVRRCPFCGEKLEEK